VSQAERCTLDALDSQGNGLRLEFARVGPRWTHRLLSVEQHAMQELVESVEGDDTQPFPPSPALQQLDVQPSGDELAVALLLGMAGKNHWSVGVEAYPLDRRIRFDVACRNQPCSVGLLGSAYRKQVPWEATATGLRYRSPGGFLYSWSLQPLESVVSLVLEDPSPDSVVLRAALDRSTSTQRWCYEFRQTEDGRP